MNEEEKRIFAGKLFDARRQELKDIKHLAHECCRRYNALDEYDTHRATFLHFTTYLLICLTSQLIFAI